MIPFGWIPKGDAPLVFETKGVGSMPEKKIDSQVWEPAVRSLVCDDKGPSLNSEESKLSLTETGLQVSMYYDVYWRIISS